MLPLHVDMTQQQMTYTENLTGLLPCEVQAWLSPASSLKSDNLRQQLAGKERADMKCRGHGWSTAVAVVPKQGSPLGYENIWDFGWGCDCPEAASCLDVYMSLTSIVGVHKRKPCLPSTAGKDDLELLYAIARFPLCRCLPISTQCLNSCYHEHERAFPPCFQFLEIYSVSVLWLSDEQKESSSPVLLCHERLWCTEQLPDSKAVSLRCSSAGGGVTEHGWKVKYTWVAE